jgi:chromosome segregation ATPase
MVNEEGKSSQQILRELVSAFSSLKQKMEDPNYIALSNDLRNLTENQSDMKRDLKELKKAMLNPFDGVIVNTNKNTEFRQEFEKLQDERDQLQEDVNHLLKWKSMYVKIFWALFTAALGIVTFLISESIINQ